MISTGDVIQITDENHPWYPCLLIVDIVKSWGVQAYTLIPQGNNGSEKPGMAFIRLDNEVFERVGQAHVVHFGEE